MRKADIILIVSVSVLLIVLAFNFLFKNVDEESKSYITIRQHGELILQVEYTEELSLQDTIIDGEHINEYIIENGYVEMVHANCPDLKCVLQGQIQLGDPVSSIVCAPHGIVISIESSENMIDG